MKFKIDSDMNIVPVRNKTWKKMILILLTLSTVSYSIYLLKKNPETIVIYKWLSPEKVDDIKLDRQSLTEHLVHSGCVLPNVAVAQAEIESGLGKSEVGRRAKNLFGITHHNCKYVSGKYGPYATYKTYRDNIKCYIHIQDYYLRAIDGKYASAPDYIQTIKIIK